MKVERLIALMALAAILTGCADRDASVDTGNIPVSPVNVSLSFSMPAVSGVSSSQTRMADEVVQTDPAKYRGLKDVHMIPFTVSGKITKGDVPTVTALNNPTDEGRVNNAVVTNAAFYRYPSCEFSPSTASVLFYAKGANTATVGSTTILATDKAFYGSTLATGLDKDDKGIPASIKFSPEQIVSPEKISQLILPKSPAYALANYLTAIAKTKGWSTTDDPKLKALYLNFIHRDDHGNFAVVAGSSANIRTFVEELYDEAGKYESDKTTADAIRANIAAGAVIAGGKVTALKDGLEGYPANIGLPDGTAAIKWAKISDEAGFAFVPQTQTTTEAAITPIDRFVYPAELCYYGNSTIITSNAVVDKSVYESAANWSSVLTQYNSGATVSENTKSIAMVSPVQYGVARLSIKLEKITESPFLDANKEVVSFGETYYPLTAVIVGGQYPVGFDFTPETAEPWSSELSDQMQFAYDSHLKTVKTAGSTGDGYDYYYLSKTSESGSTNTLVLQSYDQQNVKIVLEFENRSGKKFKGHDGYVYPGTKFYLLGEAIPGTSGNMVFDDNDIYKDRAFTQDYVTTFKIYVRSFENAYNVMPDLLTPRMEIGVEVADWESIRPTVVELQQ